MNKDEAINRLCDKEFLDMLYGFAYKRTNSSHDAQDLCSDIIYEIIRSICKADIENFYAFAWTVARRTYAAFCEQRRISNAYTASGEYDDTVCTVISTPIEDFIEDENDTLLLGKIMQEITFLSKIYRDAMVMYYIDELKIHDIAQRLNISETTVKQRLFTARNTIRKEVNMMDTTNIALKPLRLTFGGNGNPVGNDPSEKAERTFSQNLVYLCKDTPRTAKELSDILHMPMMYVEEELEIQCRGKNGRYGLLRKLDNGKYISNIIIIDRDDLTKVDDVYKQQSERITDRIQDYLDKNAGRILSFPFLSSQADIKFITWTLISPMIWAFEYDVAHALKTKYLSGINLLKREFSIFGIASKQDEPIDFGMYGCNGITAMNVCGYSKVFVENINGRRIDAHFYCAHNIAKDPQLLMTIKSINGIQVDTLTDDEKETAAKAIENGYMKKDGNMLFPNILIINSEDERSFNNLSHALSDDIQDIVDETADAISGIIKKYVPSHLMNEYNMFITASCSGVVGDVIEKCIDKGIDKGILNAPANRLCGEGVLMVVTK